MITRIEAYRYRCFQKLDVALNNFQVFVGANGSGKSTLLDIPVLIGEMVAGRSVESAFLEPTASHSRPRADQPRELVFNHRGRDFVLAVEAKIPEEFLSRVFSNSISHLDAQEQERLRNADFPKTCPAKLRYELRIEDCQGKLEITHEFLFLMPADSQRYANRTGGLMGEWELPEGAPVITVISRPRGEAAEFFPEQHARKRKRSGESTVAESSTPYTFRLRPNEPALASIPSDREKFFAANWFRDFVAEGTCSYQLDIPKMRSARAPAGKKARLSPDGTMLPWLIVRFRESDPEGFEEWIAHVQVSLPEIRHVDARTREDDGFAYLTVTYPGNLTVTSSGLSDGTLRALALSILPYLFEPPAFIAVEEPENNLHPRAIEGVLSSLSSVRDAQVFVSSHSPIVVAHTSLDDLLCLRQSPSEGTQVVRGREHPFLAEWKGKPGLSSLFSAGVLG